MSITTPIKAGATSTIDPVSNALNPRAVESRSGVNISANTVIGSAPVAPEAIPTRIEKSRNWGYVSFIVGRKMQNEKKIWMTASN